MTQLLISGNEAKLVVEVKHRKVQDKRAAHDKRNARRQCWVTDVRILLAGRLVASKELVGNNSAEQALRELRNSKGNGWLRGPYWANAEMLRLVG